MKPGWTRVSFPYYLSEEEFEYIIAALEFVASFGQRFLPLYHFNLKMQVSSPNFPPRPGSRQILIQSCYTSASSRRFQNKLRVSIVIFLYPLKLHFISQTIFIPYAISQLSSFITTDMGLHRTRCEKCKGSNISRC